MGKGESRFIIGIDLGTTNCVLSFIDRQKDEACIEIFRCPQIEAPGEIKSYRLLPSFIYIPTRQEKDAGGLAMPWDPFGERVVGKWARTRGAEVPGRLVSSAKSWLCHNGIDRTAPILPLEAATDINKISPIVATATFLRHFKAAWNHAIGKREGARIEDQDIYITIPASFDAVARDLTAKAASSAGLEAITLLEEPQAAFYAWLNKRGDDWRKQVTPGDIILVVDVGGGTSDFSIIQVSDRGGQLVLERLAVGEHLLLGGDNMDLTLTRLLFEDLKARGNRLDAGQFQALWNNVRLAKEKLLEDETLEEVPVVITGKGSGLVGGTIRTSLSRKQVTQVILDGFFPFCGLDEKPREEPVAGLMELGLPYCKDTGITRHLANFLKAQGQVLDTEGGLTPSAVIFNGGVFKAKALRKRMMEVISSWVGNEGVVRELDGADFDLAVSRGAAHFGLVRRGEGIRIRGGIERSYYIAVESSGLAIPGMPPSLKALCVVPKGLEEGSVIDIPQKEFGLLVGQDVEFKFMASNERPGDKPGDMIDDWEGVIEPISVLKTNIEAPGVEPGTIIPVTLEVKATEIGTLGISLVSREKGLKFDLEFDVRN